MWDVDFMHPIDPGMAAISDMVAYLIQQTALGLLLNPLSRADRTLLQEPMPDPMFTGKPQSSVFCPGDSHVAMSIDLSTASARVVLLQCKVGSRAAGHVFDSA